MKKCNGYLCPWFYNNKAHYLYEESNKVELVNINLTGRELQDEFEYKLPIQLVRYIYLQTHIREWKTEQNDLEQKLSKVNEVTKTLMIIDEGSDMSRYGELNTLINEYDKLWEEYNPIAKEILVDVTSKLRKSQNNKILNTMVNICTELKLVLPNTIWFMSENEKANLVRTSGARFDSKWTEIIQKLKQVSEGKDFVVMNSSTYDLFLYLNLVYDINQVSKVHSIFNDQATTLNGGLRANPVEGSHGYLFGCNIIISDDNENFKSAILFGTNRNSHPLVSIVYNADGEKDREISTTFKKNTVTFKMYYKIIAPTQHITNQYILVS